MGGRGTHTIISGVPAGIPVQAEQKVSQPFPIAGVRADAIPTEWLDLAGQVAGFGIPQGHIVDGQATMGFRLYHGRIDVGYRYIRFDFGDTSIRLKGVMFGGGVYFSTQSPLTRHSSRTLRSMETILALSCVVTVRERPSTIARDFERRGLAQKRPM